MSELGQHERRILHCVERSISQRAFSPTIEEIRIGVEMKSKDHVYRDVKRLAELGYVKISRGISRGIVLLRTADGYPIIPGGYRIPILGYIAAGKPLPLPDANAQPIDWVDVTRALLDDSENVFALRVRGNSMIDALVNDGDTIILKRQETAQNNELVAVRLKNDPTNPGTTLKRFYRRKNRVWLQPENPTLKAKPYQPSAVEIQGKVLPIHSPRDCVGCALRRPVDSPQSIVDSRQTVAPRVVRRAPVSAPIAPASTAPAAPLSAPVPAVNADARSNLVAQKIIQLQEWLAKQNRAPQQSAEEDDAPRAYAQQPRVARVIREEKRVGWTD